MGREPTVDNRRGARHAAAFWFASPEVAPGWRARASCQRYDPEMFFPDKTDKWGVRVAKGVCLGCPVRGDCLAWAVAADVPWGIWGGLTEKERAALEAGGA